MLWSLIGLLSFSWRTTSKGEIVSLRVMSYEMHASSVVSVRLTSLYNFNRIYSLSDSIPTVVEILETKLVEGIDQAGTRWKRR